MGWYAGSRPYGRPAWRRRGAHRRPTRTTSARGGAVRQDGPSIARPPAPARGTGRSGLWRVACPCPKDGPGADRVAADLGRVPAWTSDGWRNRLAAGWASVGGRLRGPGRRFRHLGRVRQRPVPRPQPLEQAPAGQVEVDGRDRDAPVDDRMEVGAGNGQ